jgi:hypothetical protein
MESRRLVQIWPDSSEICGRRWRILWISGELVREAGVWNAYYRCSYNVVHRFP